MRDNGLLINRPYVSGMMHLGDVMTLWIWTEYTLDQKTLCLDDRVVCGVRK